MKNEIHKGSIIDINQTVNGYRVFVVLSVEPLDVRYGYDLTRPYEYSLKELMEDINVIGNIYDDISLKTNRINLT